jgi:hypothetical protein
LDDAFRRYEEEAVKVDEKIVSADERSEEGPPEAGEWGYEGVEWRVVRLSDDPQLSTARERTLQASLTDHERSALRAHPAGPPSSVDPKRGLLCSRCGKALRGPGHIVRRTRYGRLWALCRTCWNPSGKKR